MAKEFYVSDNFPWCKSCFCRLNCKSLRKTIIVSVLWPICYLVLGAVISRTCRMIWFLCDRQIILSWYVNKITNHARFRWETDPNKYEQEKCSEHIFRHGSFPCEEKQLTFLQPYLQFLQMSFESTIFYYHHNNSHIFYFDKFGRQHLTFTQLVVSRAFSNQSTQQQILLSQQSE